MTSTVTREFPVVTPSFGIVVSQVTCPPTVVPSKVTGATPGTCSVKATWAPSRGAPFMSSTVTAIEIILGSEVSASRAFDRCRLTVVWPLPPITVSVLVVVLPAGSVAVMVRSFGPGPSATGMEKNPLVATALVDLRVLSLRTTTVDPVRVRPDIVMVPPLITAPLVGVGTGEDQGGRTLSNTTLIGAL